MALNLAQSSLPASRIAADQHDAGTHMGQRQAVALPMPALAPVTRQVLPFIE